MRLLIWILAAAISLQSLDATALDFSKLFKPQKKTVPRKTKHYKSKPTPTPKPKPNGKLIQVDPEWMARYWTLEAIWTYPIPEDADIKYNDGKYYVPKVVHWHYETMAETPKPTPKAIPLDQP